MKWVKLYRAIQNKRFANVLTIRFFNKISLFAYKMMFHILYFIMFLLSSLTSSAAFSNVSYTRS